MAELTLTYFFIFLVGASFGSFFNVCIYRIPFKKSIVFPASCCPQCGHKIKPLYNIPILSYILLKGRCKNCNTKIHWFYLVVEIITPVIFLLLFILNDNQFSIIFFKYLLLLSVSLIIFFIDLFHKIIPDILSLPLIVIGVLFSIFPQTDVNFKSSLFGSLFGFVIFLIVALLFRTITKKDGLGGGDIKYITAIGSFCGLQGSIFTIILSSGLGLITLMIIRHNLKKEFPFGPFLVAGTFIYVFLGQYIVESYLKLF